MKNIKKVSLISVFCLACLILLGVVYIRYDNRQAAKREEGRKQEDKIVLSVTVEGEDDTYLEAVRGCLDQAAQTLGIELEYQYVSAIQYTNLLNAQGASGKLTDIIVAKQSLLLLPFDEFAPLEGEWTKGLTDEAELILSSPTDSKSILMAPLGPASYKGLACNKKVLEECGISLPILDYNSFLEACGKLKESGITPLYIPGKSISIAPIMLSASMTSSFLEGDTAELLSSNQVKPSDLENLVKIWENVRALRTRDHINEEAMSASNEMGMRALAYGETAFYPATDALYGEMHSKFPEYADDLEMTIMPMWDDRGQAFVLRDCVSSTLSVSKRSHYLNVAKRLVSLCLTKEPQIKYYEKMPGDYPFGENIYNLPSNPWTEQMKENAKTLPVYQSFYNQLYDGEAKCLPYSGDFEFQALSVFNGKLVDLALEDWYKSYARDAKARGIPEFQ